MRKLIIFLLVVILSPLLIMLASCETSVVHQGPANRKGVGPPAHARAYGLRRKQPQAVIQVGVKTETSTDAGIESVRQEMRTVTVNITNSNGSISAVELRKQGIGYIGPKGEFYDHLPTEGELKPIYGF
jgi:hypothetical protein